MFYTYVCTLDEPISLLMIPCLRMSKTGILPETGVDLFSSCFGHLCTGPCMPISGHPLAVVSPTRPLFSTMIACSQPSQQPSIQHPDIVLKDRDREIHVSWMMPSNMHRCISASRPFRPIIAHRHTVFGVTADRLFYHKRRSACYAPSIVPCTTSCTQPCYFGVEESWRGYPC